MKTSYLFIAVTAMCTFFACSSKQSQTKAEETQAITLSEVSSKTDQLSSNALDTTTFSNNTFHSGNPTYNDWDKKIIKTATLKLEVKNFDLFTTTIHNRIKTFGGYTAGEQQSQTNGLLQNNLTIKVPVDQFDAFVSSINGEGISVQSKEITSDDVSMELVDTKARIEAKKQLRDKYAELLKNARNMKDILQIQQEINSIQEELESAAGRVNYLSHAATYSTVIINYFQYLNGNDSNSLQPTFLNNLATALAQGGGIITNLLLFLASVWPLLLAFGALYLFFRKGRNKKVAG